MAYLHLLRRFNRISKGIDVSLILSNQVKKCSLLLFSPINHVSIFVPVLQNEGVHILLVAGPELLNVFECLFSLSLSFFPVLVSFLTDLLEILGFSGHGTLEVFLDFSFFFILSLSWSLLLRSRDDLSAGLEVVKEFFYFVVHVIFSLWVHNLNLLDFFLWCGTLGRSCLLSFRRGRLAFWCFGSCFFLVLLSNSFSLFIKYLQFFFSKLLTSLLFFPQKELLS